jgi:uroporphyrinogen decarboxylase
MPKSLTPRERFLAACRRKKLDVPPAWMMRQAGRYLPEYRALRAKHDFLALVRTPELAAEVTCQPLRRFQMDAAVIFSDILVPCAAMGLTVAFHDGEGPSIEPRIQTRAAIAELQDFDPMNVTGFLADAIRRVRSELGPDRAIIGFCGAPWTTASYMIEGGSSRTFEHSKSMLYTDPGTFEQLCTRLVDNLIPYLAMQIGAGADVVQIFDSWGGTLEAAVYRRSILPHVQRMTAEIKKLGTPVILYVNGASQLLEVLADSGADVVSFDWRVSIDDAIRRIGSKVALQGNLDPALLFAPPQIVARETRRVLDEFAGQKGYIFNLGSGVLPNTPVESVSTMFAAIQSQRAPAPGRKPWSLS